jgi:hypothetical protein
MTLLYADLETYALQGRDAFVGTAGSVIERSNADGVRFYAHSYYDADGRKRERYVAGPIGAAEADAKAESLRVAIAELKAIVPSLRHLGREGFQLVDPKASATIAALHNHGVFAAGAMLVGSHAFGAIVNRMGIKTTRYTTEDVDVARREALAFPKLPERGFLEMLGDSGIEFAEIPGLDRKRPATSFKERGKSLFHVDLLVPSRDETYPVIAVPELRAHAVGLPYLGYLLAESQTGMIVAREGCCAVRLPLPERFAIHKLVVSSLRTGREAKAHKDIEQACTLCAAVGDLFSGAIADAVAALPKRAKKHFKAALPRVERVLARRAPRALEELRG